MAAPTLVQVAWVEAAVNTATNVTTASVSWQSGDLVVAGGLTTGGTGGETLSQPTTTGTGVALAQQQLHNSTGADCGAGIWAAVASGASSGTFSFQYTHAGATSRPTWLGVAIFRGSGGIGNSAITGTPSGTRVQSLTPTAADASILWIVGDWHADAAVAMSPTPTTHGAGAPGPSALPFGTLYTPDATYYLGVLDDQVSAAAQDYGLTGTGVGPFTIVAIEVKSSGGAATTANAGLAAGSAAAYAATAPYLTSGPNYGGAGADLGGGSGSWTNPGNAAGTDDNTYAVWTVP